MTYCFYMTIYIDKSISFRKLIYHFTSKLFHVRLSFPDSVFKQFRVVGGQSLMFLSNVEKEDWLGDWDWDSDSVLWWEHHQLVFKYFSNLKPNKTKSLPNIQIIFGKKILYQNPVDFTPRTSPSSGLNMDLSTAAWVQEPKWFGKNSHWKFWIKVHCFYREIDKSCSFPLKCNFIEVEAEQSWVKGKSYFRFTRQ